jgi:hypothetical protein
MGHQFSDFMRILYHFSPKQNDHSNADDIIDSKDASIDMKTGKVIKIYKDGERPMSGVYRKIPFRAEFTWDEEPYYSRWILERTPDDSVVFTVKVHIETHRTEIKVYDFEFQYNDLCYAVAKACTVALKEYGFYGYRYSTYFEEININHLLYLKAVALDCLRTRELTKNQSGKGEVTKLEDELELLLFDM